MLHLNIFLLHDIAFWLYKVQVCSIVYNRASICFKYFYISSFNIC